MHGMYEMGTDPELGRIRRDWFIKKWLERARCAAANGNRRLALNYLGEAMHTLMDIASPMHTDENGNPREWHSDFQHEVGHGFADWVPLLKEGTADITPAIANRLSGQLWQAYLSVFVPGTVTP
jgi:hypothetical protein